MGQKTLRRIYRRFVSETLPIVSIYQNPAPGAVDKFINFVPSFDYAREMSAIKLQDAWARFCRELILQSAYGRPRTYSGVMLNRVHGLKTKNQTIIQLGRLLPANRLHFNEPIWHNPRQAIFAAGRLGVQNYATISAGLGATPSPLEDLREFRNYFAHRTQRLAMNVKRLAIVQSIGSNEIAKNILSHEDPPPISLIENWIERLHDMAFAAIQ